MALEILAATAPPGGRRLQVPMSSSHECVCHLLHGSFASNVGVSDTTPPYGRFHCSNNNMVVLFLVNDVAMYIRNTNKQYAII